MKICVVIPTYNEFKTIAEIVRDVRRQNLDAVVVDDGSTDNTHQIAQEQGATVIKNTANEGKGAALVKGFEYAIKKDYDAVITLDGDGQHLTEEIPFFIRLANNSASHIFVGNRMQKRQNMPFSRVVTNKFMSWLISAFSKQRIPDSQCGFRLIKKEVLAQIGLNTRKYEIESELLIKASRLGFKIESVPIKSVYSGQRSQIHPVVDTLRFIRLILQEIKG